MTEAFAAEQAGHDPALELHADAHAARAGQEAVLLADQASAVLVQLHRQHRAGVGRGEGDLAAAGAGLGVDGGEQAFAGHHAAAGGHYLAHETAAGLRAVAEHGVHLHRGFLEHQRAGFGDRAFTRVQADFHELHFMADDAEIDRIAVAAAAADGFSRGRCGSGQDRRCTAGSGRCRRPLQDTDFGHGCPPFHALAPGQRVRVGLRKLACSVLVERADPLGLAGGMEVPLGHRSSSVARGDTESSGPPGALPVRGHERSAFAA